MSQVHLVGISPNSNVNDRLKLIADEFQFGAAFFKSCDELSEKFEGDTSVRVAVLSVVDVKKPADIAGQLQVLKYSCQECYTILIVDRQLPTDSVGFIKKSGADLIIDENDVFETSFLEFILSQRIRGSMVPIKPQDLKANSVVSFKVLTMLPLNNKLLPIIFPQETVKAAKIEKLKSAKEFYVLRDDIDKLQEYMSANQDLTAEGIVARCRVNYMTLCKSHTDFIVSLFDKSDKATFSSGKALLDKCSKLASEMLMNLSTLTDPWSVINNSTIGETGSVERSPAISAMAGLMTMSLEGVNTENTILAGLLADIGGLTLHPSLLKKIREGKMAELKPEELSKYQQHPVYSINKCLEKKIPLDDKIKNIIMSTHERLDGSGFPKKGAPDTIKEEAQLLQLCEIVDQKLVIKMGSKSENARDLQIRILNEESKNRQVLNIGLSTQLKSYIEGFENKGKAA